MLEGILVTPFMTDDASEENEIIVTIDNSIGWEDGASTPAAIDTPSMAMRGGLMTECNAASGNEKYCNCYMPRGNSFGECAWRRFDDYCTFLYCGPTKLKKA